MDKKIYNEVSKRAQGVCENCSSGYNLQLHHIVGGRGKRKKHEAAETCVLLCQKCHTGTGGVHNNRELDIKFKRLAQQRLFDKGLNEDQVRKAMGGKLYF